MFDNITSDLISKRYGGTTNTVNPLFGVYGYVFFQNIPSLGVLSQLQYIPTALAKKVTVPDEKLKVAEVDGMGGLKSTYPYGIERSSTSVTLGLYEKEGTPIYTFLKTWVYAINDGVLGLRTSGASIVKSDMWYVLTDSAGNTQKAVKFVGVYPSLNKMSAYNFDMVGGGKAVEMDVEFKFDNMYHSPEIDASVGNLLGSISNYTNVSSGLASTLTGIGSAL